MVLMMRDAMMNIQEKDQQEDDVDRWIVIDDDDMPPLESDSSEEQKEEEEDRRIINPAEEDEEEAKVENGEIPAFELPEFLLRRGEEGDVIVELQDVFRRILSGYSILC